MADEEIYPINLLTEELRSHEIETRIKTMKRVKTVALALGPERTRNELIPLLNESTEDEDEILVALGEELGKFVDVVGGPAHADCILPPLEALAAIEETVVREKAVQSINTVVKQIDDPTQVIVPLIKRLTDGDWFTSRVSACSLFSTAYAKLTDDTKKTELRELFHTLCADDAPMVRRAIAGAIGSFGECLEKEYVMSFLLNLFKTLASDDQDSVRLLAIQSSATIGKLMTEEESKENLLPLIKASMEDRSWRVRSNMAKNFTAISDAMGIEVTKEELLGGWISLLQDVEAEVRSPACTSIPSLTEKIGADEFLKEIGSLLPGLAQDAAPSVRTSMAVAAMDLAPKIGIDLMKQHLLPLYLIFLRDDAVEVRLNVLKRISLIAEWSSSMETTLLPAITELARDLQWRVREAVINTYPDFAANLGQQYFRDNLLPLLLQSFSDMVADVRLAAAVSLSRLLESVGSDGILQYVLPALVKMYDKSTIYQERVNIIRAIENLVTEKSNQALLAEVLQLAVRAARDKIPNVRFAVSQVLERLCKYIEPAVITSQIRPCLADLQNDQDRDVKFYASAAMEAAR